MTEIELRCPYGPRKLLSRLIQQGDRPEIVEGNLVELNCDACRTYRRRHGEPGIMRVRHRYNLLGELVETLTD